MAHAKLFQDDESFKIAGLTDDAQAAFVQAIMSHGSGTVLLDSTFTAWLDGGRGT